MLLNSSQCNLLCKKVSIFSNPRKIKKEPKLFTNKKSEHLNYTMKCDFMELNVGYFGKKPQTSPQTKTPEKDIYLQFYDCAKIIILPFFLCIIL